MPTKIYQVHFFDNGSKLGIMARPRGNDWLEDEIVHLGKQGVSVCVSLLEQDEINELGLQKEQATCARHGINYVNFPIPDRDVPADGRKLDALLDQLTQQIQQGRSVVIHCRMGIGRSSIIAGCLLLKAGYKTEQIIQQISSARGLKVPDTEAQVKWLKNKERSIRNQ